MIEDIELIFFPITGLLALMLPLGMTLMAVGAAETERAVRVAKAGIIGLGLAVVGYFVSGFAFQFGGIGLVSASPDLSGLTAEWSPLDLTWGQGWGLMGLRGFWLNSDAATPAAYALFFSQIALVTTAVLIPTLSTAGRVPRLALIAEGLLVAAILYPATGNWISGGGWLSNLGNTLGLGHGTVDFAGLGLAHTVGGVVALTGVMVFRLRRPKSSLEEPANLPPVHFPLFVIVGALFVIVGAMAAALSNPLIPPTVSPTETLLNLLFAASSGSLMALLYAWFTTAEADALMCARGAVAGLIAASASCAFISPTAALLIGAVVGAVLAPVVYLVERVLRLRDPSAAIAVHGVSGLWGLLAVALFADGRHGAAWNGVGVGEYLGVVGQGVSGWFVAAGFQPDIPGQLYAQLVGMAGIGLFAAILAWLPLGLLRGLYSLPKAIEAEAKEAAHPEDRQQGPAREGADAENTAPPVERETHAEDPEAQSERG